MDCIIITGTGDERESVFLKTGHEIGTKSECETWINEQRVSGNKDEYQIYRLIPVDAPAVTVSPPLNTMSTPTRQAVTEMAEKAAEQIAQPFLTCHHSNSFYCDKDLSVPCPASYDCEHRIFKARYARTVNEKGAVYAKANPHGKKGAR